MNYSTEVAIHSIKHKFYFVVINPTVILRCQWRTLIHLWFDDKASLFPY